MRQTSTCTISYTSIIHHPPPRVVYTVHGKEATRQLQSIPIAVPGSVYTGKQINSFDTAIHMQESPPHKRFSAGCSSPFMRLAEHLTRRFVFSASNACLIGKQPHALRPVIVGMRGSVVYDYGHAWHEYSPPPSPSAFRYVACLQLERVLLRPLRTALVFFVAVYLEKVYDSFWHW